MTTLADAASALSEPERIALISQLQKQSKKQIEALVRGTQLAVYREWMTVGRYVDDAATWAATYAQIVSGAQITAHSLTLALTAEHVSLAVGQAVTSPAIQVASLDWLASSNSISALGAQAKLRSKLLAGVAFDIASDEAGRFAHGQAARDLQSAQRFAGSDWNKNAQVKTRGWRKVPSGAACGWCIVVADQVYRDAETVPAHAHDRCGFSPVVDGDGWKSGSLSGGEWRDVIDLPASPDAATVP